MLRPSEKLFHKTLRNDIQWMKLKSPAMQKRMALYEITENMIIEAIRHPDSIIAGYRERSVYQRKMGKYVLRVIVKWMSIKASEVITVYKAKSERYGI